MDNAIHFIKSLYPLDNAVGFPNTYMLDSLTLFILWMWLSNVWTRRVRRLKYSYPKIISPPPHTIKGKKKAEMAMVCWWNLVRLLHFFLPFIFQTSRTENAQLLEQKGALEQENNEVLSTW